MSDFPRTEGGIPAPPGWIPGLAFRERFWIAVLLALVAFVALLYLRFVFLLGFDHDEVEHAHAAFRILSGELPYRDFYQNHWPAYWLLTTQFVESFPFSIQAILAGRAASLLALTGSWLLGLHLLQQIPGGRTKLAVLVYTAGVLILAVSFQFYLARPDPIMTLFATAGLCLLPARGAVRNIRAFGAGLLFGLAVSLSSKALPMVLVVPLVMLFKAVQGKELRALMALVFYAAGFALALLPTIWWIHEQGLFEAFYFDVFGLNLAMSKHWLQSFALLKLSTFPLALLGMLAWGWAWWNAPARLENGFLIVLASLVCGFLLAVFMRHGALYNLQVLTVPLAVGFAALASFLWMHARDLGNRLLIIAALLAYPLISTATKIALMDSNFKVPQSEVQALMDLARPGSRTCIAFSPVHPVFCHSVSELSNRWDYWFAQQVSEPRQLQRFHRIWHEGIERTLHSRPDIILRRSPGNEWEKAVEDGLISQDQLDALDLLLPAYEPRMIGEFEVWIRRIP